MFSLASLHTLDAPFADELRALAPAEPTSARFGAPEEERTFESSRLLVAAERAIDELDEADAMSTLRQAIRIDPGNREAARLLAELCYAGTPARGAQLGAAA